MSLSLSDFSKERIEEKFENLKDCLPHGTILSKSEMIEYSIFYHYRWIKNSDLFDEFLTRKINQIEKNWPNWYFTVNSNDRNFDTNRLVEARRAVSYEAIGRWDYFSSWIGFELYEDLVSFKIHLSF